MPCECENGYYALYCDCLGNQNFRVSRFPKVKDLKNHSFIKGFLKNKVYFVKIVQFFIDCAISHLFRVLASSQHQLLKCACLANFVDCNDSAGIRNTRHLYLKEGPRYCNPMYVLKQ